MKQSAKFGLVTVAALACLEAVQFVRPRLAGYFLPGVLPNLLAAIAIPFFFLSVLVEWRPGQTAGKRRRWFHGAVAGAGGGVDRVGVRAAGGPAAGDRLERYLRDGGGVRGGGLDCAEGGGAGGVREGAIG